jgi:hypothetical protein
MSKISERKLAANRKNAQNSTGPANTVSTRFNAQKHGLLSQGVTELDNPQTFEALVEQLKTELQPVGILEQECVQQIALLIIRLRRARCLEAEAFTACLNPAKTIHHPGSLTALDPKDFGWTETLDGGLPAQLSNSAIDEINRTVLRYETSIENKLFRRQNQFERLQRLRRGEKLPAPAAIDLNVNTGGVGSFGNSSS